MIGDNLIKSLKNPVKCGQLKYINLDCKDLDQILIKRSCRLFNRLFHNFRLEFTPTLRGYDALFVPDDITHGNRDLVTRAIFEGILSIVVQHGVAGDPHGFLPLKADYFLCWPEDQEKFVKWGMQANKILPFTPQAPKNLKKISGVEAVFFLAPPAKGLQFEDENSPRLYTAREIQNLTTQILIREPNLLIKPHPKYFKYIKGYLNPKTITSENAYDLIYSAERIYSFGSCTTVKDAEVLGKKAIIIDRWLENCFNQDRKHMYAVGE